MDLRPRLNSGLDPLPFVLISATDHVSGVSGVTPSRVLISKACGPFATPAGSVMELGGGRYQISPNTFDLSTPGPLLLHVEAPGCDTFDGVIDVASTSGFSLLFEGSSGWALPIFAVRSFDSVSGCFGQIPSVQISYDGSAFMTPFGAIQEVGGLGNGLGWYYVTGNSIDTGIVGPVRLHWTGANILPGDATYNVRPLVDATR